MNEKNRVYNMCGAGHNGRSPTVSGGGGGYMRRSNTHSVDPIMRRSLQPQSSTDMVFADPMVATTATQHTAESSPPGTGAADAADVDEEKERRRERRLRRRSDCDSFKDLTQKMQLLQQQQQDPVIRDHHNVDEMGNRTDSRYEPRPPDYPPPTTGSRAAMLPSR
jgi:hypothetical protein